MRNSLQQFWDDIWTSDPEDLASMHGYDLLAKFDLHTLEGKNVLDVGCGNMVHSYIERRCASLVGVDISAAALTQARAIGTNAALIQSSATALPFADNSFDAVIAFETLPLLSESYFGAIREMTRVSKNYVIFNILHPESRTAQSMPYRDSKFGRIFHTPQIDLAAIDEKHLITLADVLHLHIEETQVLTRGQVRNFSLPPWDHMLQEYDDWKAEWYVKASKKIVLN